jgi:hypothetical protein
MRLTVEHIRQFQELYRKHLGKDISEQEALDKGLKFVHLMARIYRPMTREEYNAVKKRQIEIAEKFAQKHTNAHRRAQAK